MKQKKRITKNYIETRKPGVIIRKWVNPKAFIKMLKDEGVINVANKV
ncbi:MAG: hypothetical protein WC479_09735 [Candidatus Izemoplasmatales bacterium]